MLDYLKAKRENLIIKRIDFVNRNDEELITERLSEFENQIRKEISAAKEESIAKIDIKLEVIDELIREQEELVNTNEVSENIELENEKEED